MESLEDRKDPLNVEELIRQGLECQKKWKKPSNELPPTWRKPWRQIMDDRLYHG